MRPSKLFLPLALVVLAACDETDAVAVRLVVESDFSGTVRTSALAAQPEPGESVRAISGAQWESQVAVECAAGRFASLEGLAIADIALRGGTTEDGMSWLRVSLPRGAEARWPRAFVPLTPDERQRSSVALDPSGRTKDVGATIKLEIELPGAVVGNGLTGRVRGTRAKAEDDVATLVVAIDVATSAGEPIVWHLTWQR